jgi:hypothetical protein
MKSRINNILEFTRRLLKPFLHDSSGSTHPVILNNHPSTNELRLIISTAKEKAENSQTTLGDISSRMQNVIDGANATLPLIAYMDTTNVEEVAVLWSEIAKQTEHSYHWLEGAYSSSDSASGTVSLSSTTISGIFSPKITPYSVDPDFHAAWIHYIDVANRPTLKADVINLIQTFHLDIAPTGKKSPLELFRTAHQAFESPISKDNPVITSLVPMREAVESALDELLKLRPQQESTGSSHSKKILSIGAQLKKDFISDVVVQEWADQWHDISDKDLSASKRYHMTREEWSRKLIRATQFFHSFLTGLDPMKTRKP